MDYGALDAKVVVKLKDAEAERFVRLFVNLNSYHWLESRRGIINP